VNINLPVKLGMTTADGDKGASGASSSKSLLLEAKTPTTCLGSCQRSGSEEYLGLIESDWWHLEFDACAWLTGRTAKSIAIL
jgi:hypothetical protein